jgi:uncharacterized protein
MVSDPISATDPAAGIALTRQEIERLGAFLASEQVPDTAMPLEALDGFFTALVVGPEQVMAAEYMPVIWDTLERNEPVFGTSEQRDWLDGLLSRHWSAIARRIAAGIAHMPLLEDSRPGQEGCAWCYGFMVGVGMRLKAWQPLLDAKAMQPLISTIVVLAEADELSGLAPTPPEERADIVEALTGIPLLLHRFWRDRNTRLAH